jgi:multisubunit Na+/H+ antiporter MnhE subunit
MKKRTKKDEQVAEEVAQEVASELVTPDPGLYEVTIKLGKNVISVHTVKAVTKEHAKHLAIETLSADIKKIKG